MIPDFTHTWTLLIFGTVLGLILFPFARLAARGLERMLGLSGKADVRSIERLRRRQEELAMSLEEYERMSQLTAWQQEELAERNEALERQTADAERLSNELARRVEDLKRALAQVGRMHRDEDSFLRHELRNSIAPILGYAEMMRAEPGIEGPPSTWLDHIRKAAESMERLLSDLRDLQAIERGDRPLGKDEIALDEMVRSAIRMVDPSGAVPIEARLRRVIVHGDPTLLPGVFVNLIRNAVEHVGPHPDRLVTVEVGAEDGWAEVTVGNGGPAIDPARISTFFDRFNSTKEGGTGLGTSYADLVVRAHGGAAEVRSDPETGTVVTIRLPQGREVLRPETRPVPAA